MTDTYVDAAGNVHEGINYSDSSGTYVCPQRFTALKCGERLYDKPGGTLLKCHTHGEQFIEVVPESLTEVVPPLVAEAGDPPTAGPNAPASNVTSEQLAAQIQELLRQHSVLVAQEDSAKTTQVSDQETRMALYREAHPDEFDEEGNYTGTPEPVAATARVEVPEDTPDHDALVEEYTELAGSPPDGRWGDARIQQEIDEIKAAQE